jgi:hypothetical protein
MRRRAFYRLLGKRRTIRKEIIELGKEIGETADERG